MVLHHLLGLASRMASSVADLIRAPGRHVAVVGDRTHIEVCGLYSPGTEEAARRLEEQLAALDGVHSAQVNAVLSRVVVTHDRQRIGNGDLVRVVGEIEQEQQLDGGVAPASVQHPANLNRAFRELLGLGVSLAGLGLSVTRTVLPVPRLSPLVAGLVSLVDSAPWLHTAVETTLGRPAAHAVLVLGGATSHALASGPLALLTTAGQRLCLYRDATARRQSWERFDTALAGVPGAHRADPLDREPRPIPVPDGPVERVANRSAALALAGYAVTLAATRNGERALGVLLAGVPRAAKAGRDAFAAQLGHDLCARGGVVLDPDALRRLDRVDTVVLDRTVRILP